MVYVAQNPHVKIHDLAFVRFLVPDLPLERQFFLDFGLSLLPQSTDSTCYFKGKGVEPVVVVVERAEVAGFGGLGMRVKTVEELEAFASKVGGKVEKVGQGPWSGETRVVRLKDPDGYNLELLAGGIDLRQPRPSLPHREPINEAAGNSYTRTNQLKRMSEGPSNVVRLGHVVLDVTSFLKSEKWYKDHFGLITSDEVKLPDGKNALGAFMRCDRGEEPTDHHTLFLVGQPPGSKPQFNHAAFEVADFDDLMLGNSHLKKNKRAKHTWGVARHVLGSQIFDYWNSPHGFTCEHWTDGDLLSKSFGSHEAPIQALLDTQWGDATPKPWMGSKEVGKQSKL